MSFPISKSPKLADDIVDREGQNSAFVEPVIEERGIGVEFFRPTAQPLDDPGSTSFAIALQLAEEGKHQHGEDRDASDALELQHADVFQVKFLFQEPYRILAPPAFDVLPKQRETLTRAGDRFRTSSGIRPSARGEAP